MRGFARSSVLAAALWAASAAAQAAAPDDRVPLYFERAITADDLRGKTLRELEIARATILARAGMVFLDRWLREYLASADWYEPGRYDVSRLSAVDVGNLRTLAAYRAAIPRTELEQRWDALLAAHRYAGATAMQHRLAFSEDGTVVAVGASPLFAPRWPLRVFRTITGERIGAIPWANGQLHALRFVGPELAVASDYEVRVGGWRSLHPRLTLMVGAPKTREGREPPPSWACISPDATSVLVQDGRGLLSWNVPARRRERAFSLLPSSSPRAERAVLPDSCAFIDARRAFMKADQLGVGYVLELGTPAVAPLPIPPGNMAIAPHGGWLARWEQTEQTLDGKAGDVELWKLGEKPARVRVRGGSAGTLRVALSPDGSQLVIADGEGRLVHWNTATGARTLLRDRTERVTLESPDDASDALDAPVTADLHEDRARSVRTARLDPLTALLFSADGRRVLVASQSGSVQLFDPGSGKPAPGFRGHDPWTEDSLWEATLIARRLGVRMDPSWPKVPEFVDPLQHLAALEDRLPEAILQGASRARLRLLRNAIIARRGGTFESPLLRSLLSGNRYQAAPGYTPDRLTTVDRENILRIKRRERALGGPIGDAALQAALDAERAAEPLDECNLPATQRR